MIDEDEQPKSRAEYMAILQQHIEDERERRRVELSPRQTKAPVITGLVGVPGGDFMAVPASPSNNDPGAGNSDSTFPLVICDPDTGEEQTINVVTR